jgi:hypothetical protein
MSDTKTLANPLGRPKGSKNEVTIIKVALELATRRDHLDQMQRILKGILDDAENGDKDMRKLVWQSVMTKGGSDQAQSSGEAPQIVLRVEGNPKVREVKVIEGISEEVKDG